jgi:hypothetical protein
VCVFPLLHSRNLRAGEKKEVILREIDGSLISNIISRHKWRKKHGFSPLFPALSFVLKNQKKTKVNE